MRAGVVDPRPCGHSRRERGAGTVLVLALAGAVTLVLAGALVVLATVRDAHRARAAADLAALAAAGGLVTGGTADCASAATVATAVGAELQGCRTLGDGSVLVEVSVPAPWPPGWPGLPPAVTGAARAGPDTSMPP